MKVLLDRNIGNGQEAEGMQARKSIKVRWSLIFLCSWISSWGQQ